MEKRYEELSRRLDGIDVTLKELKEGIGLLLEAAQINTNANGYGGLVDNKTQEDDPDSVVAAVDINKGIVDVVKTNRKLNQMDDVPTKGKAVLYQGLSPAQWKTGTGWEFVFVDVLEDWKKSSDGDTFSFEDVRLFDAIKRSVPSVFVLEDVMGKYQSFKKFDKVSDHSDHYFSKYTVTQAPSDWEEKLRTELDDFVKQLPENMLVRAYEGRVDLLRAVIIGPQGTPYHDGLFFFDLHFPSTYPTTPPLAHYWSDGLRIHENITSIGAVCLVQTIRDEGPTRNESIWVPRISTMVHFMGFLKSLFCAEPLLNGRLYNNPNMFDGVHSVFYNELAFIKSVKTMVVVMNQPPIHFEAFVAGHFRSRAVEIKKAIQAYLVEGVQVGCYVGGVPKQGNRGIVSTTFVEDLTPCLEPLDAAFARIGANFK